MESAIVIVSFPLSGASCPAEPHLKELFIGHACNLYEAVDYFRSHKHQAVAANSSLPDIPLRAIINLHNAEGIKDKNAVKSMACHIQMQEGKEIFAEGLPLITLCETKLREFVLINGHHTLLASMKVGRRVLHEIPYLFVKDAKKGYVEDKEIHVLFGKHAKKLKRADWRLYTLNWQAPEKKQLCRRKQGNIGELFDAFNAGNSC